jgi:hypothetical protein
MAEKRAKLRSGSEDLTEDDFVADVDCQGRGRDVVRHI